LAEAARATRADLRLQVAIETPWDGDELGQRACEW
jgi:hypothetical protein